MKLSQLKSNPNNPRTISDHKLDKLIASIKDFDAMLEARPIIVNKDYVVLGGNMRLLALQKLGYEEIPDEWIKVVEFNSEQELEFIIKDNVGFGDWDWEILNEEWDIDKLGEWGLDILDKWFTKDEKEVEEDDYEMPSEIQTDIVLGDLIEIGNHRLLCGDSTDSDAVAKLMDGKKADLVLTDPPYGIGYEYDKHKDDSNELNAKLVWDVFSLHDCGKVWTSGLMNLSRDIERFGKVKVAVWYKKFAAAGNGVGGASTWEPILILNPPAKNLKNDVIELMVEKEEVNGVSLRELHSCPKPVKLYGILVESFTEQEHLIFEPFGGSGTTIIAAHQLKRTCYSIEMSPNYCQVIVDRMQKLDPTLKIKINGNPYEQNRTT